MVILMNEFKLWLEKVVSYKNLAVFVGQSEYIVRLGMCSSNEFYSILHPKLLQTVLLETCQSPSEANHLSNNILEYESKLFRGLKKLWNVKKKITSRMLSTIFIWLNVQNNRHSCLYIVAFFLNIFENFWCTLL